MKRATALRGGAAPTRRGTGRLLVALCTALLVLSACARTVASENLAAFSQAATAISKQSQLSFDESNKLARDFAIDRKIRTGGPGLSEDQFQGAVSQESMDAWKEALTGLADYGTTLASLVDTSNGAQTSDGLVALAGRIQAGPVRLKINDQVATGFAALAGALVDARAQRQATHILQAADPHVQLLLSSMAEAIGANDSEGLRGTVHRLGTTALSPIQRSYAAAFDRHDERAQRELIQQYLDGLAARDAQLRSLENLRGSLINLAAAHAAAAKGGGATLGALISQIQYRLDETQRIYEAIEKNKPDKNKAGKNDADQ